MIRNIHKSTKIGKASIRYSIFVYESDLDVFPIIIDSWKSLYLQFLVILPHQNQINTYETNVQEKPIR